MSDLSLPPPSDGPFLAGADRLVENRLLRRIIEAMSADHDLHEVTQQVAVLMTEATGADVCFVHVVEEDGRRIQLVGATPPLEDVVGKV